MERCHANFRSSLPTRWGKLNLKDKFVAWRKKEKTFSSEKKTFSQAIFAPTSWFMTIGNQFPSQKESEFEVTQSSLSMPLDEPTHGEEIKEAVESLKNFALKASEKQGKNVMNFEGTQLKIKSGEDKKQDISSISKSDVSSLEDYKKVPVSLFGPGNWSHHTLGEISADDENLIFLFGDPKKDIPFDSDESVPEKWLLLNKMISAMDLKDWKVVVVYPFSTSEDTEIGPIIDILYHWRPKLSISFGASMTNLLAGKGLRLTDVHGQKIERDVSLGEEKFTYRFYPIFHPEFLLINPKMKRTTWVDLQKVIEYLKVSSS